MTTATRGRRLTKHISMGCDKLLAQTTYVVDLLIYGGTELYHF